MANYGNRYTDQQLAILERILRKVYSDSKADLDEAVDRYYNGYTETKNGKTIVHPGMYDRLRTELEAYERGEYTQEEFTKWWWAQEGRGKHIEAMRDEMARAMTETNMRAAALINDETPGIYAMNANWTAYTIAIPRQDKNGNWTKDVTDGVAFNLINEQTVRELVHDKNNHVEFRVNSVNRKSNYAWNKQQITNALLSGVLQGESVYKIADRFMIVQKKNMVAAIRNARTSFTSAQNAGSLNAMTQAVEMGIKIKKQWMATRDKRTRDRHLEMNGEQQEVNKKFSNGLMYPGDAEGAPEEVYNCRCTMVTVDPAVLDVDSDPYDVEGFKEWMDKKNTKGMAIKDENGAIITPEKSKDYPYNNIFEQLINSKVEYKPVYKHDVIPDEEQIIRDIAKFDETGGSCSSVALAYIGQKLGFNVHDFRGGESKEIFEKSLYLYYMSYMKGMATIRVKGKSSLAVGNNLLKKCELNKEYCLAVGRHCAIVRKIKDGEKYVYQYLELQTQGENGWTNFDNSLNDTLTYRFGCDKMKSNSSTIDFMIDIDASKFGDDFITLLGYLNTTERK